MSRLNTNSNLLRLFVESPNDMVFEFCKNVIASTVILNVLSRTLDIILESKDHGVSNQGFVFTSIK